MEHKIADTAVSDKQKVLKKVGRGCRGSPFSARYLYSSEFPLHLAPCGDGHPCSNRYTKENESVIPQGLALVRVGYPEEQEERVHDPEEDLEDENDNVDHV